MDAYQARFSGVGRLFSREGLDRLRHAHVAVIGLGGVGSWAVEALARSGLGRLTLVDLDDVCISNVNRQVHALQGELGKPKVEVMARRASLINPECQIRAIQGFFLKSNADELLSGGFDYVVDAIDSPSLKCLLIAKTRELSVPLVSAGAAGGRRDPTRVEVVDLADATHDRLLQEVRRRLRRLHGFPRNGKRFGVECVISREPVVYARKDGAVCSQRLPEMDLRLDCHSGYGTAAFVTGTFGFAAAACVVEGIAAMAPTSSSPSPESKPQVQPGALESVALEERDTPSSSGTLLASTGQDWREEALEI